MKPVAKFHVLHENPKKVMMINGPRPSPLMINKDSHLIRKPSSHSTSVISESKPHEQKRKPIIIYTQSPKVIHTKPQDFMALVQRLTSMVPSDATASLVQHQPLLEASENFGSSLSDESNNSIKKKWKHGTRVGDETRSANFTDGETCVKEEPYVEHSHSILGFADMPLFTPNFSDFHCSSRSEYKYSDSPYGILGSLLSPSGLEFMRELPEY